MKTPDDTEPLCVRPNARTAFGFGATFSGFFLLLFAGFWLYDTLSWPAYAVLHPLGQRLAECVMVSTLAVASVLASYYFERRRAWLVSAEGITVLKGESAVRTLAWSDVRRIDIMAFGAVVHLLPGHAHYNLYWLARADTSQLRLLCRRCLPSRSRTAGKEPYP